jgi:surface antigen
VQDFIMDKPLRLGTLLVCLGFSGLAHAQTDDGPPVPAQSAECRAIAGQTEIDGATQQVVGRACLQPDGTWQIVQSPDGSVLMYPVDAYPYPDPWYWGPPLFIGVGASFIFIDRFHRFHHFDHFHQMDHSRFGARTGAGFHHGPFPGGGMHGSGGMRGH